MDSQEAGGLIMARRGRGGRRGQGNRRGGFGRARGSVGGGSKSKSKSKSSSRGRRGGQGNRGKGFGRAKTTVSRKSVGKGLRSVAKAAGKVASKTKGFAGVRSVAASARAAANKVKQARADRSSKQARQNRRHDRMARQFGLDTRDMRKLKINVDVNRALNHFNVPGAITKRIPKSIRDFRFNAELGGKFRSPHKLGVREGYRAPNRGGSISSRTPGGIGVARDMMMRPEDWKRIRDRRAMRPIRGKDQQGPGYGLFPMPTPRPIRDKPERDWLADFYDQYNIGSRGGSLDQEARDYWSKEAEAKGQDAVKRIIFNTAKAEGTLGGAFGNPEWGMIKDTWTGPHGRKHYSFENTDKQIVQKNIDGRHGGRRRKNFGKPPRNIARPLPWKGKGRAKPTGRKPTSRGFFPSIAATMAARGF